MRASRGSGVVTGTQGPRPFVTYSVRNFSSLDEKIGGDVVDLRRTDPVTNVQKNRAIFYTFSRSVNYLAVGHRHEAGGSAPSEAIIISRPEFRPMLCLCRRFRFRR